MWKYGFLIMCVLYVVYAAPQAPVAAAEGKPEPVK